MLRARKPVAHAAIAVHDVNNTLDCLGFEHARGVDAFAKVCNGVFAIKLGQVALRVDIGHQHATRDRSDIDSRIARRSIRCLYSRFAAHKPPLTYL